MAERTVLVRLRANPSDFNRAMSSAKRHVSDLRNEIDTTNDRTAWLAQSLLALGPALVPLGAAGVPIIAGLVTQMTLAVAAGGTMALAFNGIGDAVKALNDYELEPTVENLEKMNLAMEKVGPAGADFVRFLDEIGPKFATLQDAAREGAFPGLEVGIEEFATLIPKLRDIVGGIGEAIGDLSASAGKGLAGPRFRDFFNYLDNEAQPILMQMGRTAGNLFDGLAAMIVAFGPLTKDFSGGFEDMSESFADWAHERDSNDSFLDFLRYIEQSTPKALDFLGSLTEAFVAILGAAAPVGDVMLPILSRLLDVIAALAETPLGPMFLTAAAAMSIYGRGAALLSITTGGMFSSLLRTSKAMDAVTAASGRTVVATEKVARGSVMVTKSSEKTVRSLGGLGRGFGTAAGAAGILAASLTDIDDKAGLTNTTMLGLTGLMIGGPWGLAIGTATGGLMDLSAASNEAHDSVERLKTQLSIIDPTLMTTAQRTQLMREVDLLLDDVQNTIRDRQEGGGFGDFVSDVVMHGVDALPWVTPPEETVDELNDLKDAIQPPSNFGSIWTQGLGQTREQFDLTRMSAEDFKLALMDLEGVLGESSSSVAYERALDALQKSFKEGKGSFSEDSDAGLTNIENAITLTQRAIDRMLALKEVGKENAALKVFDRTIADLERFAGTSKAAERELRPFIDALKEANGTDVDPEIKADTKDAMGKLTDYERYLLGLPPRVDTKVRVLEWETALERLARIKRAVEDIPRRWQTDYFVNQMNAANKPKVPSDPNAADGTTVPKTGLPYADRHPYLLADGEEVVSNRYGQADRNRDLLKAINAGMLADGGTAGMWRPPTPVGISAAAMFRLTTTAAPQIDLDEFATAVAQSTRPLVGTMTVEAQNINDIRRDLSHVKALSGMDRVRR